MCLFYLQFFRRDIYTFHHRGALNAYMDPYIRLALSAALIENIENFHRLFQALINSSCFARTKKSGEKHGIESTLMVYWTPCSDGFEGLCG